MSIKGPATGAIKTLPPRCRSRSRVPMEESVSLPSQAQRQEEHEQAARLIMRNEAPGLGGLGGLGGLEGLEGLEGLGRRCSGRKQAPRPGREPANCPSCPLPAGLCL